jgi:hypothetical protein
VRCLNSCVVLLFYQQLKSLVDVRTASSRSLFDDDTETADANTNSGQPATASAKPTVTSRRSAKAGVSARVDQLLAATMRFLRSTATAKLVGPLRHALLSAQYRAQARLFGLRVVAQLIGELKDGSDGKPPMGLVSCVLWLSCLCLCCWWVY